MEPPILRSKENYALLYLGFEEDMLFPSSRHFLFGIVTIAPVGSDRITPLIWGFREMPSIYFRTHSFIACLLFRTVCEMPEFAIDGTCLLQLTGSFDALFLEHSR